MVVVYADRCDAGRRLAAVLARRASARAQAVVLALPRGGVIVAAEVARALRPPLDVLITRKVPHPASSEFAVAAVSEGGALVTDPREIARLDPAAFARAVALARAEAERRRWLYVGEVARIPLAGTTAIIVDDGVATGLTMRAALRDVREGAAARIVVAVPVASVDAAALLAAEADELVILTPPEAFAGAVGAHYRSFAQVSDDEVIAALALISAAPNAAKRRSPLHAGAGDPAGDEAL